MQESINYQRSKTQCTLAQVKGGKVLVEWVQHVCVCWCLCGSPQEIAAPRKICIHSLTRLGSEPLQLLWGLGLRIDWCFSRQSYGYWIYLAVMGWFFYQGKIRFPRQVIIINMSDWHLMVDNNMLLNVPSLANDTYKASKRSYRRKKNDQTCCCSMAMHVMNAVLTCPQAVMSEYHKITIFCLSYPFIITMSAISYSSAVASQVSTQLIVYYYYFSHCRCMILMVEQ